MGTGTPPHRHAPCLLLLLVSMLPCAGLHPEPSEPWHHVPLGSLCPYHTA